MPLDPSTTQDVPYSFSKCQYQQAWYCTALNCVAGGVSADQANAVLATQPSEDSAPARDTQEPQAEPGTDLEALLLSLDPEPSAPGAAPDQVELTHEELDHILTGGCTVPDIEAGPAAAQAPQANESSVPGGAHADFAQDPSLPPRARPLTPSDLESLELAGLDARVAALYCLYCLHSVQPRRPRVKIYLSMEHQAALLGRGAGLPRGGDEDGAGYSLPSSHIAFDNTTHCALDCNPYLRNSLHHDSLPGAAPWWHE